MVRLGADDRPQRYRFPARFQPFAIRNDLAYGVQVDSLDVERIATVRIPE